MLLNKDERFLFIEAKDLILSGGSNVEQIETIVKESIKKCSETYNLNMRRFTSSAPARGARAPNRAISNS